MFSVLTLNWQFFVDDCDEYLFCCRNTATEYCGFSIRHTGTNDNVTLVDPSTLTSARKPRSTSTLTLRASTARKDSRSSSTRAPRQASSIKGSTSTTKGSGRKMEVSPVPFGDDEMDNGKAVFRDSVFPLTVDNLPVIIIFCIFYAWIVFSYVDDEKDSTMDLNQAEDKAATDEGIKSRHLIFLRSVFFARYISSVLLLQYSVDEQLPVNLNSFLFPVL